MSTRTHTTEVRDPRDRHLIAESAKRLFRETSLMMLEDIDEVTTRWDDEHGRWVPYTSPSATERAEMIGREVRQILYVLGMRVEVEKLLNQTIWVDRVPPEGAVCYPWEVDDDLLT